MWGYNSLFWKAFSSSCSPLVYEWLVISSNRSNMYFIAWHSTGNILPPTSHIRVNLPLGSTIHHHWTVISICKYQQCAMKTHSSFHCWVSSCWYRIWIISWETSRPDLCNYSAAVPSTSSFQFISKEAAHTLFTHTHTRLKACCSSRHQSWNAFAVTAPSKVPRVTAMTVVCWVWLTFHWDMTSSVTIWPRPIQSSFNQGFGHTDATLWVCDGWVGR